MSAAHKKAKAQGDVVAAAREVVEGKTALKVGGVLLDAQTAQAITAVAENLTKENLEKLRKMDVVKAGTLCWKLVSA